jgi:transcriptional regulator with XRE-family HTH domain
MSTQTLGFSGPADDNQTLGARLKEAREYIGLKQEQVASHLTIPRTAVSEIEKGKRTVSAIELKKLAHLYQRSVQFFTGDDPVVPADVAFLARTAANLSNSDRQELQRFAEFLQSKSKG